jgi:hypothetical protein
MRTLVIVGLTAGAVAVFAPDQGAGLMRSVAMGLAGGLGARLRTTCLLIIVGETCRLAALDRRDELCGREKDPPTYRRPVRLPRMPRKAIFSPAKRNTSRRRGFRYRGSDCGWRFDGRLHATIRRAEVQES